MRTLLLCLLLAGCIPTQPPPPPPTPGGTCDSACSRERDLGCPGGNPTPTGHSCEEVCRNAQASTAARVTPTFLGCVTAMQSCEEESQCAR